MTSLVLIGAGGHARVAIASARAGGEYNLVALLDDRRSKLPSELDGVPVVGSVDRDVLRSLDADRAFIAIGDNAARLRIAETLDGVLPWATIVHPRAWVAPTARIADGVLITAMVVVQPGAIVERHAILNTGCSVDHDSHVGQFAHIAPGAKLCGNVMIGDGALVGTGASLIPGVVVGKGAVVGAGAAVIANVPAGATATGVPARVLAGKSGQPEADAG